MEHRPIDPNTAIGVVTLAVADLPAVAQFYREIIGLTEIEHSANQALFGSDGRPLLRLTSLARGQGYPRRPGLFHLALLLPSREDLGQWLRHLADKNYPLDGAADHLVSEALYLSDPEGNGIEIYRDRPRSEWQFTAGGEVKMATMALDLQSLLTDGNPDRFDGMPDNTNMGHIHLQVNDLAAAVHFYHDILGFDKMATMPGAGFLGAGGYHHHLGVNVWRSRHSEPRPANALGLRHYEILLPATDSLKPVISSLEVHQINFDYKNDEIMLRDPAGNNIVIRVSMIR